MSTPSADFIASTPIPRHAGVCQPESHERPAASFEQFFARADKRTRTHALDKLRTKSTAETMDDSDEHGRKTDERSKDKVASEPQRDVVAMQLMPVEHAPEYTVEAPPPEGVQVIAEEPGGALGDSDAQCHPLVQPQTVQGDATPTPIQAAPAQSASNGTNSAQYAAQMKKSAKTGQSEQTLPNEAPRRDMEVPQSVAEAPSPVQLWSREVAIERATTPVNLAETYATAPEPVPVSHSSPEGRVRAVEAAIDQTIVRFRRDGLDSLIVTVRPDANTEIRLRIAQDGDGILIAASLERGEIDVLSEHWPGLQWDLQQRGVILSRIEPAASNLPPNSNESWTSDSPDGQRSQQFIEPEESDCLAEANLRQGLQRRQTSAMTLTSLPIEPRGQHHFEYWA